MKTEAGIIRAARSQDGEEDDGYKSNEGSQKPGMGL